MTVADIVSAGAVITRRGKQVLLVHRPRYDDWSFPKGKVERGEHITTAAVREVAEETGVDVRLGPPLQAQRYPVGRRMKTVHYWVARAASDDDVTRYLPNAEIDAAEWVGYDEAMQRLTYPYDRGTLRESALVRKKTRAIVVLRHARARSRSAWRRDDRLRPLVQSGNLQAQLLLPLLAAYDVSRLESSASERCVSTLRPYAELCGQALATHVGLTEEDATTESVIGIVDALLDSGEGGVICTHGPVLPTVFDCLGVSAVRLQPGAMLVVHHRKGKVVATERHQVG